MIMDSFVYPGFRFMGLLWVLFGELQLASSSPRIPPSFDIWYTALRLPLVRSIWAAKLYLSSVANSVLCPHRTFRESVGLFFFSFFIPYLTGNPFWISKSR
ncbi:hypothetical protein BC938DRAFT_483779, partial [Jimgerdemannia flammicorona]